MTELTELLAVPGLLIAIIWLLVLIFNAIFGPFLRDAPEPQDPESSDSVLVSVLVPARNEERSIAASLDALSAQDYPDLEILVLDDGSSDGTAGIVESYAAKDTRIRLISGSETQASGSDEHEDAIDSFSLKTTDSAGPADQPAGPPSGWTGKNWACHRLAQAARGEILLFTDADNTCRPDAVRKSVNYLQAKQLGLLSAFPHQKTVGLAEKLAVPMVDLFVYAGLPLWLTYLSPNPALAAANGQWMMWARAGYDAVGGHSAVRSQIVEDTELARRAKQHAVRTLTFSGRDCVFGRMYHSAAEVRAGFAKNLFGLTGFRIGLFAVLAMALLLAGPVPYLLAFLTGSYVAWATLAVIAAVRLLLAWRFAHPLLSGLILHPVAVLYILLIALDSLTAFRRGHVEWKERHIPIRPEVRI